MAYLFVGLGGFIGATARYWLGQVFSFVSPQFPLVTLCINLLGSFLIGVVSEASVQCSGMNRNLALFLKVGVCGGFTTFSSFSLETLELLEEGRVLVGISYAGFSAVICVVGVLAGKLLVRAVKQGM